MVWAMCTVDAPETESESDSNRLETLCKAPPALPVCNQTFHSQHIDRGSLSLRPIADVCGSVIAADARCSSLLVPVGPLALAFARQLAASVSRI